MKYWLVFILSGLSLAQDVKLVATDTTLNSTSSTKLITTTIVPITVTPITNSSKVELRASRPVNGFRVSKTASQFMATIRESPSEMYLCSAIFIKKNVLLTTARCLFGRNLKNLFVHFNPKNLLTTGSGNIAVKKVYIHPDFDFGPVTMDFSLIILKTPANSITPVSLPHKKIGRPGSVGTLYTWRFTPSSDKFVIHEHKSKIISTAKCYLIEGEITPEEKACAEGVPYQEGKFDHGMPFIIRRRGKNYLFGINEISRKLTPQRVEKIWKVVSIMPWIADILKESDDSIKPTTPKPSSDGSKDGNNSNKDKAKGKGKGKNTSVDFDDDDIDGEIANM